MAINFARFLVANSTMNDDERDRIDCEVEEIIQVCTENIKKVRKLLDADHECMGNYIYDYCLIEQCLQCHVGVNCIGTGHSYVNHLEKI